MSLNFAFKPRIQRGANVRVGGGRNAACRLFGLSVHKAAEVVVRRRFQLRMGPRKNHTPLTQDQHVIRDAGDAGQIVTDDDHGHFRVRLAHVQQQLVHLGRVDRVEPGRRFVAEQQRRFRHDGAGEAAAFLHPAGQFVGIVVGEFGEPHEFENPQDGFPDGRLGQPGMLVQRQADVFRQGEGAEKRPVLKQHAETPPHPPELAFGQCEQILPAVENMPVHRT